MKKLAAIFLSILAAAAAMATSCASPAVTETSVLTRTAVSTVTTTTTATTTVTGVPAANPAATVTAVATITVAGPKLTQAGASVPPPVATTSPVGWPITITGQLAFSPSHAPVGARFTATGTGFAPSASFALMWQDVTGAWDVRDDGNFYGHVWNQSFISIAALKTDASGGFAATFAVPPGFGFNHTVDVVEGSTTSGTVRAQTTFNVDMQASLATSSGVLGSPITLSVTGMGWQDYLNGWGLIYDNAFTGVVTSTTTHGAATAVIPATGGVGQHVIQLVETAWSLPFMNILQSPYPQCPTFTFTYNVIAGTPVLPLSFSQQSLATVNAAAPAPNGSPQIWTDVYLATVGTPMHILGNSLPAGAAVDLGYWTMSGSRVSGGGFQQVKKPVATATVSATGTLNYTWAMPDAIGGTHVLEAAINGQVIAQTTFNLTPSASHITPGSGPVGTVMDVELKGLSWTETANCYYMVVDNALIGYTCGFNNGGTINIPLPMAGQPGWHYVDFYPGIYKGTDTDTGIDLYRDPMLTFTDHPGENLPAFHFAYMITG